MALNVQKLSSRYHTLRNERDSWDEAWRDLAELFLPTHWRSDTDNTAHKQPKINGRLVNSVGILAMRTLSAGMQGGMTSPVRPWFKLGIKGVQKADIAADTATWLDTVSNRMQQLFHQSNFYNIIHTVYGDLGTFGTACMIETANEDGLNFGICRAGEYCIDTNSKGEVDTLFRRLHMTSKQMIDQFGWSKVPACVQNRAKAENMVGDDRWNVIHGIFPRADYTPGAPLSEKGKPYVSVYWLDDNQGQKAILSEGGYDEFPAFCPRWDVAGQDVYGRSPAMDVVADCRMLQAMTATMRMMQHKAADPPLMADSTAKSAGVDNTPGMINYLDMRGASGGRPLIAPLEQPEAAALQYTLQAIQEVESRINDGLYVDLFRLMIDDNRQGITATEVQARQQEKMVLVGPVVERLQKELLQPLVVRTFHLMLEYGAIPEPPATDGGAEIDIEFESVLAQAQKLSATSSISQSLAFAVQCAQVNPDVLDIIDMDEMLRNYLDRMGFPLTCIRAKDEIEQMRQAKQQQMQQAQEQQAMSQTAVDAQNATQAAANLSNAQIDADGSNALQALLGSTGG